eukprot:SAG11_NODE_8696_length_986_cov_1.551297_1_plen_296_part_10
MELTSDTSDDDGDDSPNEHQLCMVQCVTESMRTMLVKPGNEKVTHVRGTIDDGEEAEEAAKRLLLDQTGLPTIDEELTKVETTQRKDDQGRDYTLHRFVMVMARRRIPGSPKPGEIGPHWFKKTQIVEDTTIDWLSNEDLQLALKAIHLGPELVKQTAAWENLTVTEQGNPVKICDRRGCEKPCDTPFSSEERAELGREDLMYANSLGDFCSIEHMMSEHTTRCLKADPAFPICDAEGCHYAAGLHLAGSTPLQDLSQRLTAAREMDVGKIYCRPGCPYSESTREQHEGESNVMES